MSKFKYWLFKEILKLFLMFFLLMSPLLTYLVAFVFSQSTIMSVGISLWHVAFSILIFVTQFRNLPSEIVTRLLSFKGMCDFLIFLCLFNLLSLVMIYPTYPLAYVITTGVTSTVMFGIGVYIANRH